MAVAWNHLQIQLIDRLGLDGLSLARQLAMTTYRSETDFDERFGRYGRGRWTAVDRQLPRPPGRKLVDRFDPATYRILAGAMDRHDIGAGGGGLSGAFAALADAGGTRLTGVGIEDDILYGPRQVDALVDAARSGRGRRGRVPRDPLDQGPRRLPRRVGPADGPAAGGARGLT